MGPAYPYCRKFKTTSQKNLDKKDNGEGVTDGRRDEVGYRDSLNFKTNSTQQLS